MIISRFTKLIERAEYSHVAFYDSIDSSIIFCPKDEAKDFFRNFSDIDFEIANLDEKYQDIASCLAENGFIVSSQGADEERLKAITDNIYPSWSFLYLILTNRCNLACKYCFMEAGLSAAQKRLEMDWNVAKSALDKFIEQRDRERRAQVWLYGGEPLLNADIVYRVLDYMLVNDSAVEIVMVTNGALVDDDVAKKLSRYPNLRISVSIDGPQEVHDANRVKRSGAGSFDEAINGFQKLQSHGISASVSYTVGEDQASNLAENAHWMTSLLGVKNLGINLLIDTESIEVSNAYTATATEGLIRFFQDIRHSNIVESRIMRKVDAFIRQKYRVNDCAACGNQIVVSPEGNIGICHEGLGKAELFADSILREDYRFCDDERVQKWAKRTPFMNSECLQCEALGICGGGCPYGAKLRYGDIFEIDRRFCVHTKMILDWLIWDLYDQTLRQN